MWLLSANILALLIVCNGAPILAEKVMRSAGSAPVDFGLRLADGRPLFGSSKTWRGLAAALLLGALLAPLLGFTIRFGLSVAALSMLGDLFSSFLKRRRGLQPGDRCLGLDQLPEALLPSVYAIAATDLAWWWIVPLPLLFMLLHLLLSQPLYHLNIRNHPH